ANIFVAKARGFESALHASLFSNAVPVELYGLLLKTAEENLKDTLHRYVAVRKKAMKLDKIHYYDLYNPLIEKVEKSVDYENGVEMIGKSLAPLGGDYAKTALNGMKAGSGWTDIYPNKGKRSGAYCTAAYGEAPYVFMNFMNELEDVFTLAHEYGHAMHYYYSIKHQPYPTYESPIFLAEIASTFNEELLLSHLLKKAKTKEEKLFLLNKRLENIRTTVFRQVMFAEFEWLIHKEIEGGGALTAQRISEIYGGLIRKYYGPEFEIGENDNVEWSYVPHFYYNFYVFQYATGLMSAIALSQKVLKGEKGAVERYLDFLKSGGSDYPLNILKKAGVDFSTPEPMLMTFELFRKTLDEFEKELQP
ncbi:MAG: oligoendopeptidase F family protein, partial [Deltaproteobacteria bacterium]|nr:oligoendopeptidase F family protein [Deltaproteobacteria bacterium]